MKNIPNIIPAILLVIMTLYSCSENESILVANAPADGEFLITSSENNIILDKLVPDTQTAITFDWDKSWYGIDTPTKFTIQMDDSDGDFSEPATTELIANQKSYTHADLNSIALKLKLIPDVAGEIKIRLKASLNYGALPAYSNTVIVTVTPYKTLLLKYPMPTELYLQGDAVPSNWGTPVTDIQKMVQIDDHRFGLIVYLTGGKNFSFITSATTWSDPAYRTLDNFPNPVSNGTFEPRGSQTIPPWGGDNIKSPTVSGVYQVIIDFTTGTYSITPADLMTSPAELYIIGDATANEWAAPGNAQKFTKVDNNTFTLTTTLKAGKFAFLNANATWSTPAYVGKTDAEPSLAGNLTLNQAPNWAGSSITAPNPGNYTITVNFKSGTYVLKL
jgi:hypothetical protein